LREAVRGLGAGRAPVVTAPDGRPFPPAYMIEWVAGTPDPAWFWEGGRRAAQALRALLDAHGVAGTNAGAVLDFGCGCGRVVRHLRGVSARLHGCDSNKRMVGWCRSNLPFATFAAHGLRPPTAYAEGQFDLVYAFSVLTHLDEALQRRWMEELWRLLRPGGHLVISTHGAHYRQELTADERALFDQGHLVVREPELAGLNACGSYHPRAYVEGTLGRGFDVVAFEPEGAAGNPHQDLYLLRRG
jgi:SAM-dependent methyltransferase